MEGGMSTDWFLLFFCVFAKLSVSGRECCLLGGMLILAIGLCPAYIPFPLFHRTLEPDCLRKGQNEGREGAGMQVRASMRSCDSIVCWQLIPG